MLIFLQNEVNLDRENTDDERENTKIAKKFRQILQDTTIFRKNINKISSLSGLAQKF